MKYLSLEQVISLHSDIMESMNGLQGYNSTQITYLESALTHIQNDKFYPSFFRQTYTFNFFLCKIPPPSLILSFWMATNALLYTLQKHL